MIDIEKFLCSLLSQAEGHRGEPLNRSNIQEALREQGCEIVNGKLIQLLEVDIERLERSDDDLKLLKGHWYKSAIMIDDLGIEKDDVLYCSQDGYLDKNNSHLLPSELKKWLRFFDEVPGKRFKVGSYIKRIGTSDLVKIVQVNDGFYRVSDIKTDKEYDIAIADENYYVVQEFPKKLSDLDLILEWFAHIEQMADDRKTQNGYVMRDSDALDEIKVLAKNSQEYIKAHVVPEKIVFVQRDIDQMVCKFKNEPLRSDGRVADIYRRGIEDTLKELKLRYGQGTTD